VDRQDLSFRSGNDSCAAWLYPAAGGPGSKPIIAMAHGLSGTRRDGLGPFAERFAAAGIAALVFDHRGFGDSAGEPDLFHPKRQLEDWRAAISYARSIPGVDPDRLATFGSSMGGGNALAAAAGDPGVAAAVSQVPFLDIVRQSHRSSPRVTGRMLLAATLGRHLPAVGQPDEAEREQRVRDLTAAAERNAKALNAATLFELDDVVDPAETRSLIAATLAAAARQDEPLRGRRFVDTW